MAPARPPDPSAEEILNLRNATLKTLEEKGLLNSLDPRDMKKFETDDGYVAKFLTNHDNEFKLAHEMAVDTLPWRKEVKANDLTHEDGDIDYLRKGALCFYNMDRDKYPLLLFSVRHHIRGSVNIKKLKNTLIYLLERNERSGGDRITVFFDMQETGIKNMDMDFIQYMINIFKLYYPSSLNYILVFEMPWILNAMWKIIKGWLPPKALEIIKFIDKKSVQTYISADQCLTSWGGTHTFNFNFTIEEKMEATASLAGTMVNGDIDNKKVHFDDTATDTVSAQPIKSVVTQKKATTVSSGMGLEIEPSDDLLFSVNRVGATASILLTNRSTNCLVFKVKTTSPDKYRVKPSVGIVEPSKKLEIVVVLCDEIPSSILMRDKFLIMATATDASDASDYHQILRTAAKENVQELRLRVGLSLTEPDSPTVSNHVTTTPHSSPDVLISKLDLQLAKQSILEEQFIAARKMLFVTLVLMIAVLCMLIVTTMNLSTSIVGYSRFNPREEL